MFTLIAKIKHSLTIRKQIRHFFPLFLYELPLKDDTSYRSKSYRLVATRRMKLLDIHIRLSTSRTLHIAATNKKSEEVLLLLR